MTQWILITLGEEYDAGQPSGGTLTPAGWRHSDARPIGWNFADWYPIHEEPDPVDPGPGPGPEPPPNPNPDPEPDPTYNPYGSYRSVPLSVLVYVEPDGELLADWTTAITDGKFETDRHGHAALNLTLNVGKWEAMAIFSIATAKHIEVVAGVQVVYSGRIESKQIDENQVGISAFGYWRAAYDVPYTAFWVDSLVGGWKSAADDQIDVASPDLFEVGSGENELSVAPRKAEQFSSSTPHYWLYKVPETSQGIKYFKFYYKLKASSPWKMVIQRRNPDYSFVANAHTVTGNGNLQQGFVELTIPETQCIAIAFYRDNGTLTNFTAETGTTYLKIYSSRLQAEVGDITPELIGAHIIEHISSHNPTQLKNISSLLTATGEKKGVLIFEDNQPSQALNKVTPDDWAFAVWEERTMSLAPVEKDREWFVDIGENLRLATDLDAIYNSVYTVFNEAGGDSRKRTAVATDDASKLRTGLNRQTFIESQTSDQDEAEALRDARLIQTATERPRASLEIDRLFDKEGNQWPVWMLRAGHRLTMRNMPPNVPDEIASTQSFLVGRTNYNFITNTCRPTPENEEPSISALLAKQEAKDKKK